VTLPKAPVAGSVNYQVNPDTNGSVTIYQYANAAQAARALAALRAVQLTTALLDSLGAPASPPSSAAPSAAFLVQSVSGWAVMVSLLSMVIYLFLRGATPQLWVILGLQALLLFYTHRADLRQRPRLRKWLSRK
jgi:hypothetical protein